MRRFNIVHTESSLGWGGQEWRVFLELQWMREQGHQVWLAAPKKSEIFHRSAKAGIPVIPINFNRSAWLHDFFSLFRFFKKNKIQIVNTHSSRDGWLGGIVARISQIPFIIRSRHIEVNYENPFLARIAFEALPHHVLTTSHQIAKKLVRELSIQPNRITCLATGVDLKKFSSNNKSRLRTELKLASSSFLVGMISVLRSWKGHDDFLVAASQLAKESLPVHFVIAGEGPGKKEIEKKIHELALQSQVTLLGYREDIPDLLDSLDVLVLPSTAHEGIPQIILQAQAMARPVIGTRVGGIPEVIISGQTGLLIPPRDPNALAEAVRYLIFHPAHAREMGINAQAQVNQHYSLDLMGKTLESIYHRYLGA
jgi:glycosyltransferase involved in cell wall biosynthesis